MEPGRERLAEDGRHVHRAMPEVDAAILIIRPPRFVAAATGVDDSKAVTQPICHGKPLDAAAA
jgi:hypothetical protein